MNFLPDAQKVSPITFLSNITSSSSPLAPPLNFDSTYYLNQYPDVAQAVEQGIFDSALDHWQQHGQAEGRSPNGDTYDLLTGESRPRNNGNTVDLALIGSINPLVANLQDEITYSYTITNNGPDLATGVSFTDDLPFSVNEVQAAVSQGTVRTSEDRVTAALGNLDPGQSATVTITRTTVVANILTNVASVSSNQTDSNPSNNQLQLQTIVNPVSPTPADLELSFDVPSGIGGSNGQFPIVLTITNLGPGIATNIQVQTVLPAGVAYLGDRAEQGTYDSLTGIWNVGNIRDNLSRTLTLNVAVDSSDTVEVIAELTSVTESDPDSTPGNNNPEEDDRAVARLREDGGAGSTLDSDYLRFLALYGLI
jgi:uncharacterized repeat protein (TIGR01451 family)